MTVRMPISAAKVAEHIREAMAAGWDPESRGKPFVYEVAELPGELRAYVRGSVIQESEIHGGQGLYREEGLGQPQRDQMPAETRVPAEVRVGRCWWLRLPCWLPWAG